MAAILNFPQKLQNTKMLISQKLCEIRRFRWNFLPTGCLQIIHPKFQKNLFSQMSQPFWIFAFFAKKHKSAYISKTMGDRAISTKFLTHRVSLHTFTFFQNFISPKWRAFWIFEFLQKHKNAYISKTVRDRAISTKIFTHRVSLKISHRNFQKNFSQKWWPFWILKFFFKMSRKPCQIKQFRPNFWPTRFLSKAAIPIFKKKFLLPKMVAILNFSQKLQNTKMLISLKPC